MPRKISSLIVLIAVHLLAGYHAIAQAADQLALGTGQPGSESHQLGVGLTALVKAIVLPNEGIDIGLADENHTLNDKHLVIDQQTPLKTLLSGQSADTFPSVMAFRAREALDGSPLELIARADISAERVYAIVRAIFENGPFLNTTSERVWNLSIDETLRDLQFPIHPGALRYYRETGGLDEQTAEGWSSDTDITSTNPDDRRLKRH